MILRRYIGVMPIERLDSDRAYDRLVQLIQSGLILEEQALSERKLADKRQCRRRPVGACGGQRGRSGSDRGALERTACA